MSRGDLISEAAANLGTGERHLAVVEFEQTSKVDKVTLSGLGTKVALDLTGRADVGFEHEVELDWFGNLVSGVGVDNLVLANDLTELGASEVVNLP